MKVHANRKKIIPPTWAEARPAKALKEKKSLIHCEISTTRERTNNLHNPEDARLSGDSLAFRCERWDPGTLAATQRYGRRKYLRATCCRFEHMGELSPPGIYFYLYAYQWVEYFVDVNTSCATVAFL